MTKKEQALIEQYAKSLVEVASEHHSLDTLQADVLAILETFETTNLDQSLSSLAVPHAEKIKLLTLLERNNSVYMNNFLNLILQNEREAYLYQMLQAVLNEIAIVSNQYDVTVTSSLPLTEEQKSRVRAVVAKKFAVTAGRLIEKVDPSLIGGFIISVNNKVIDTSIRRQLQAFKMNLK
ncbi:TPA: F0F1 ATP synthase subunit delta [Streptococcus pyogenes]|uniref:F0F1 ATP synthase subunit delta n=1 Tax=Streptococcus pyogenes TaxID=1314 RepID=UPI000DA29CDA|nr:F0F1 ATP synthase subunit delta [Streptococcus pyogenes]MYN36536.1 F0F1 ATP synthase subunit delta [Streptococcus pyogenes]NSX79874.1 F0F1 ATP synthase subunit delta [Streptococcus pyogenes]SQF57759.1 ATP synthase delta chain [Streptococcus pyogenes]VGT50220.1 ATP synthase delta chain [Streptococcus pyogenes]HEP1712976.1 F0F1 ATP synthase subunit delta [Streptococcus pyogenes]